MNREILFIGHEGLVVAHLQCKFERYRIESASRG